ncbi:MBL fold metallo-hydrolase [Herbiconiux sp. YIM B11900]|uniref:MBL fold metallo-hydrolase n=1 Tax=Herbiconiux sp. YIM B11900 TaxID=3404131 RepID=UPI003F845C28
MSAGGDVGWREVAAGVFQRRYEPVDVSVVAIVGPEGVVIVDTRNNPREGEGILRDSEVFGVPVVAAVNTHAHYDHSFGNQAFAARGIPIHGHAGIAEHYERFEGPRLAAVQADPSREPDKDWGEVRLTPPDVPVGAVSRIAPGGRAIELIPLPPGHTDTDLAVRVPDAAVWLLGDVIEQSGAPMFGSGSYPLRWGAALRGLGERIGPDDVIVPGHGEVVDRAFVLEQARLLEEIAAMVRRAGVAGTPVDDVLPPDELAAYWPDWMLRSALRAVLSPLGGGSDLQK